MTHDGASVCLNPETTVGVLAIACMDVYATIVGILVHEILFINEKTIGYVSPRASRLPDLMPVGQLDFAI
jgi:hypothetical protein